MFLLVVAITFTSTFRGVFGADDLYLSLLKNSQELRLHLRSISVTSSRRMVPLSASSNFPGFLEPLL